MSFTPFVLRVHHVHGYCEASIGVLFFNSSTVLSSLRLDFPIMLAIVVSTLRTKGVKDMSCLPGFLH